MAKKKRGKAPVAGEGTKLIAKNRKAFHDYFVIDRFEAGMVLTGSEVKSLRNGNASLQEGFARIDGHEAYLIGIHIPPYENAGYASHDPLRKRKLLLKKREIARLEEAIRPKGVTLVPLALYWKRGIAKVEIGLMRGKQHHDKRQDLKSKDAKREIERATGRRG